MSDWESTLAAFRMMDVGSGREALVLATEPSLREVIAQRCGHQITATLPAVQGWQAYCQGFYSSASAYFIQESGSGWLRAWADLGMAKIASDCGFWRAALDWCAAAWQRAAAGEHLDLLAEISGTRGEILLRAGQPAAAAASLTDDLALLSPGSRFAGRVRCYLAHAWSRMGSHAQRAAKLYYQLAAHSASEIHTRSYSTAGLAVQGLRILEPALVAEALEINMLGLPRFWVLVCQAKLQTSASAREKAIQQAIEILPPEYHAEHWWVQGWLTGTAPDTECLSPLDLRPFPLAILGQVTAVEMPVNPKSISDAPWWDRSRWPRDIEGWWALRDHFMP